MKNSLGLGALQCLLFVLFVVFAVAQLSLYAAVLVHLWLEHRDRCREQQQQQKRSTRNEEKHALTLEGSKEDVWDKREEMEKERRESEENKEKVDVNKEPESDGKEDEEENEVFNGRRSTSERESRPFSAIFFTEQSTLFPEQGDSFVSLLDTLCGGPVDVPQQARQVTRTMSEGEAMTSSTAVKTTKSGAGASSTEAEFHRSASNPAPPSRHFRDVNWLQHGALPGRLTRVRAGSDATADGAASPFPPVAYSAQLRSLISLNMDRQRSRSQDEGRGQSQVQQRGTASSLLLGKLRGRRKQTTLMFILVTLIYLVSYLPYLTQVSLQTSSSFIMVYAI
jgi:hypothetical protein